MQNNTEFTSAADNYVATLETALEQATAARQALSQEDPARAEQVIEKLEEAVEAHLASEARAPRMLFLALAREEPVDPSPDAALSRSVALVGGDLLLATELFEIAAGDPSVRTAEEDQGLRTLRLRDTGPAETRSPRFGSSSRL